MSDQLLRAAQIEEAVLLTELRRTVAFCKLEAVRGLIAAYSGAEQLASAVSAPPATAHSPRSFERSGSLTGILTRAAAAYLAKIGRRAQVTEILPVLQAEGHVIGGKKPDGTLSSALSHSELFDNVRGKGYGLVEWGGTDGPASDTAMVLNHPGLHQAFTDLTQAFADKASALAHENAGGDVGRPTQTIMQGNYSIADDDGRIRDKVA